MSDEVEVKQDDAIKPSSGKAKREAIELLTYHTHAGREYPPGTMLVLADVGLAQDSAQWLVTLGKARWV